MAPPRDQGRGEHQGGDAARRGAPQSGSVEQPHPHALVCCVVCWAEQPVCEHRRTTHPRAPNASVRPSSPDAHSTTETGESFTYSSTRHARPCSGACLEARPAECSPEEEEWSCW